MRLRLITLLLLLPVRSFAGDTLRVLFIGNSYTYVNDLPAQVQQLAQSNGDYLIHNSSTPGSYNFQGHSVLPATLSLIAQGNWDYVVLQEQSQIPSFPDAQVQSGFYPYAKKLDSLIHAQNSCARTVFYMTWGRKNGDAGNCPSFPPVCTYNGMDSMLRLRYTNAADSNDALISPVSNTWRTQRLTNPGIELYDTDESHPSPAGTYAAACTFYAVLFGKNPAACTYNFSLTPGDAAAIRNTAKQVVFDSLAYWKRFNKMPDALFQVANQVASSVQFLNNSEGSNSYKWYFGDGDSSVAKHPLHAYTALGNYTVVLKASRCEDWDTATMQVSIQTLGLGSLEKERGISIFPNPAHDMLYIKSYEVIRRMDIMNVDGRMIYRSGSLQTKAHSLRLQNIPAGVYTLNIYLEGGVVHERMVKE